MDGAFSPTPPATWVLIIFHSPQDEHNILCLSRQRSVRGGGQSLCSTGVTERKQERAKTIFWLKENIVIWFIKMSSGASEQSNSYSHLNAVSLRVLWGMENRQPANQRVNERPSTPCPISNVLEGLSGSSSSSSFAHSECLCFS